MQLLNDIMIYYYDMYDWIDMIILDEESIVERII